MRYLLSGLSLLLVVACSRQKTEKLTGKWTSVFDAAHPQPAGYTDTFCFFGKDSFFIRIYMNNALQQDTRGTYRFDSKENKLSTVSARGPVTFDVEGLEKDTLRLSDGQGGQAVFSRVPGSK